MGKFLQSYDRAVHLVQGVAGFLPQLCARLTLGAVFIESGWGKLHNLDKVVDFFRSLGIPAAELQAPFVASVEFCGGFLILLGLFTRLASAPLFGTMVVAILTAKLSDLHSLSDLFGCIEYLYGVLLIYLMIVGGGSLAVDPLLLRARRKGD